MIRHLVLATHNKGKLAEIRELLMPLSIEVSSAGERNLPEPEETSTTFHANALIKARAAQKATGFAALADDSGLSIDALGGAPGVYTADWAGPQREYSTAFARIQQELQHAGAAEPFAAHFICILALVTEESQEHYFEGRVHGRLTFPPRGSHGFGYDPVFIPDGHDQTFGELPLSVKQQLSHRARAMSALVAFLHSTQ